MPSTAAVADIILGLMQGAYLLLLVFPNSEQKELPTFVSVVLGMFRDCVIIPLAYVILPQPEAIFRHLLLEMVLPQQINIFRGTSATEWPTNCFCLYQKFLADLKHWFRTLKP